MLQLLWNSTATMRLVILNVFVGALILLSSPLRADPVDDDGGDEFAWKQVCDCVKVDAEMNCTEYEDGGCPISKIQTCGATCVQPKEE